MKKSKSLKELYLFLILEVASVLIAAGAFALISNKVIAGGIAGGYFCLFGLFMLYRIMKWPKWWETWTLYPLLVFLFGCAIPMIWQRFTHLEASFNDVRIWGIPGPEFHHFSTSALGLLFLVNLAEAVGRSFNRSAGRST